MSVGAKLSALAQKDSGAHPASYTMGTGLFPGVKGPGRGVNHPPSLTLRLKKEYCCTSTPLRAFMVCYGVNVALIYLFARFYDYFPILHSSITLSSVDLLLYGGEGQEINFKY